jgi:hypothetical protein
MLVVARHVMTYVDESARRSNYFLGATSDQAVSYLLPIVCLCVLTYLANGTAFLELHISFFEREAPCFARAPKLFVMCALELFAFVLVAGWSICQLWWE